MLTDPLHVISIHPYASRTRRAGSKNRRVRHFLTPISKATAIVHNTNIILATKSGEPCDKPCDLILHATQYPLRLIRILIHQSMVFLWIEVHVVIA